MKTLIFLIVGIAVFVVIGRLRRQQPVKPPPGKGNRSKRAGPAAAGKVSAPASNPYRAISVVPGGNSCAAVQALEGNRYLVVENNAPQLPLEVCDALKCACKYVHYKERRDQDGDRRGPPRLQTQLYGQFGESEKRDSRGRRSSD